MAEDMKLVRLLNEEFLTCKVCWESFKNPKILDCLHSFCTKCLHNYVEKKTLTTELPCPLCRQTTAIGRGVGGLRDNFFLVSLKEATEGKVEKEENATAVEIVITEPEEEKEEEKKKSDGSMCKDHHLALSVFCLDCGVFICNECVIHAKHQRIKIEEAMEQLKKKLEGELKRAELKISAYAPILNDWENYQREFNAQFETIMKAVEERKDEIQNVLNKWYANVTVQVLRVAETERREIKKHMEDVRRKVECNVQVKKAAESFIRSSSIAEYEKVAMKSMSDDCAVENVNAECLRQRTSMNFEIGGALSESVFGGFSTSSIRVMDTGGATSLAKNIMHVNSIRIRDKSLGYRYDASSITSMNGRIFITDRQMDTVVEFTATGDESTRISTAGIGKTIRSVVTPAYDLICSRGKSSLCVYKISDCDGQQSQCRVLKDIFCKPYSLAIRNNRLYVLDQDLKVIFKLNAQTYKRKKSIHIKDTYTKPHVWDSIAVNSHHNVYLCAHSESCIYEFTSNGLCLAQYGRMGSTRPGDLYWPRGITIDQHDNVIVADTQNNRLQMLNPKGTWVVLCTEKESMNNPTDVTVISHGKLITLERTGNAHLYEYEPY